MRRDPPDDNPTPPALVETSEPAPGEPSEREGELDRDRGPVDVASAPALEAGPIPPELEPVRAEELAKILGTNRKTVYEAVERGEIPGAFRVGRLLFFSRPVVLAWLGQGASSEE